MEFREAVKSALIEKFAAFSGRAGRAEFLWFWLFLWVASTALLILITALGDTFGNTAMGTAVLILAAGVALALLVPSLAVSVRRLHDTNRSGWWLLLSFTPFGGLVLLVFWLQPTGPDNRYGPGMAPATSAGPRTAGSPPSGSCPIPSDATAPRIWDGHRRATGGREFCTP